MSRIKIYIDEDAMDSDLVEALRSRGITVITALDAGLTARSDDQQLAFASEHGCVLYTFNVSDFYRLYMEWAGATLRSPGEGFGHRSKRKYCRGPPPDRPHWCAKPLSLGSGFRELRPWDAGWLRPAPCRGSAVGLTAIADARDF